MKRGKYRHCEPMDIFDNISPEELDRVIQLSKVKSRSAKRGFQQERDIVDIFNNYQNDPNALKWISTIFGDGISTVKSVHLSVNGGLKGYKDIIGSIDEETKNHKKADLFVCGFFSDQTREVSNISVKSSSGHRNHLDRRKLSFYQNLWGFSEEILLYLRLFTGEALYHGHTSLLDIVDLKDDRRVFMYEFKEEYRDEILSFFDSNKKIIIRDVVQGRGKFKADWIMVVRWDRDPISFHLVEIEEALDILCQGGTKLTKMGNIQMGKVYIKRKGGTGGATNLQFQFNPFVLLGN